MLKICGNNLNNVSCETSRYIGNKKGEFLKDKIDELTTNSKNKNNRDVYRGANEFKRGYQPRTNLVNGDLLADSQQHFEQVEKYVSQLLNVPRVSDVRRTKKNIQLSR
jgi:hypothetical protein